MTKKLYLDDSYTKTFIANIVEVRNLENSYGIILNQTGFYPEGGGQPSDQGFIGNLNIYDVQIVDDQIIHYTKDEPSLIENVECRIDWTRRFDYMQQHAGQHILSSAFEKLFDANTVGFHLSTDYVTIDLDKKLVAEDVYKAEDLSNAKIWENLVIGIHYPDEPSLMAMPLRKPPKVTKDIRIIEVADFDFSPCGGTHPKFTGEIGQIKVRRFDQYKSGIRVEFVCGQRALTDFRLKNEELLSSAASLSVPVNEVFESIERQKEQISSLKKTVRQLEQDLIFFEVESLKHNALKIGHLNVIKAKLNADMKTLKTIAASLVDQENTVVLLGSAVDGAKLIFSSTKDTELSMKELIKVPLEKVSGRGGGNNYSAQGGGSEVHEIDAALDWALDQIKKSIAE